MQLTQLRLKHPLSVLLALAAAGCAWQAAQASQPPASLKAGIQAYGARQYGQAISHFKAVSGTDANNPYTHYYLALSYQGLGQFSEAEKEYRWNYERNLDKDLRYMSWQGMQGLQQARSARVPSSVNSTSSPSSALPSNSDGVGGSISAAGNASGSHAGSSNAPAAPSRQGKYILDGSTRAHVSNPLQMEWIPGCPRHR